MIKKVVSISALLLIFTSFSFCEYRYRFSGIGLGGNSGLAVTEYGPTITFGGHGFVELTFGKAGRLQIMPSIGFWFKTEKSSYTDILLTQHKYTYNYRQVALNLTDIKYFIPIPRDIFIEPYAGIGLLTIVVNVTRTEETEITQLGAVTVHPEIRRSGSNFCINLFAGTDFPINNVVIPFVEARFSATPWKVFRVLGGVTFCF